ncbi:SDR family oxidoreductase [Spiroplasma floricola]|uniref:NAD(P)-dependent oxidoreductase n=1 Tax=Spiroplasma floricola 23-6 TaxID=1336749 RepID=A0A2K8SD48_9MOLU|nr:SDR family oxidoreductase [Spiroplasma floricola]AUB31389.1 NAD(P)-dependent oxidoreductase [Spiroplasma floricola 23-6]
MKKKLVVITGASSGIGKELAKLFIKDGYPVLLLARRVELLKEFESKNVIIAKVDVTNFDQFEKAVRKAEDKFGLTDLIINNAGVMYLDKIYNLDLKMQNEMFDINVKGVLNGMNIVINDMKNRNAGTIINVGSVAGRWTGDDRAIYNGSKFAIRAITEQSRKEMAKFNVRVLTIEPALVDTNLSTGTSNSEVIKSYQDWKQSLDKGLESSQVAEVILYMYKMPQEISLKEIVISSTKQSI